MEKQIQFTINEKALAIPVKPHWTLSHLIREELKLTGTKEGCGEGECGSCTVLVDGKTVNACLFLAVDADGKQIQTIEGLSNRERLHPLQEAFIEKGAIQCGYCTPGMIMSAKALLDENPTPTEEEIKYKMAGNLCRCTGYAKIVEAIQHVADKKTN